MRLLPARAQGRILQANKVLDRLSLDDRGRDKLTQKLRGREGGNEMDMLQQVVQEPRASTHWEVEFGNLQTFSADPQAAWERADFMQYNRANAPANPFDNVGVFIFLKHHLTHFKLNVTTVYPTQVD